MFKDYKKQLKVPFVIYADFESITTKINSTTPNPASSYTEKYQHHEPCGFSYVIVSEVKEYCMPPVVYRGPDAVDKFLESLLGEEQVIQYILDQEVPMIITPEQEEEYQPIVISARRRLGKTVSGTMITSLEDTAARLTINATCCTNTTTAPMQSLVSPW